MYSGESSDKSYSISLSIVGKAKLGEALSFDF
jgi:hypothetical protein